MVLAPAGVYKKMGINVHQLGWILLTKLTIDDRRPNTIHQTQRKKKEKPVSAATLGTVLMSLLLGLLYLMAFTMGRDAVTKLTFYFSFFFFMLASSLISDFTTVLIDVRDNFIILPKPVNDRTIVTARILHIFIHICKLVIPMSLPGLVAVIILYNLWGGFCFMLMVLMLTLFTIFFINALYIFILKVTTPQKFQAIISYVQIIFAILLYASFQVLPRMIKNFDGVSFSATANPLFILFPSYWFASGWSSIFYFKGSSLEIAAALISLVLPVFSLYVVIKYLAPSFNNKLAMMSSTVDESKKISPEKKTQRQAYSQFLSRIFTKTGPERMGFLFTWKMSARSRDFRMKVYPAIGYLLVYVVVMLLQSKSLSIAQIEEERGAGKIAIVTALYICSYLPIMAISQSGFSERYKAAWIYLISPLQIPGLIIRGSIKASLTKFFIPLAILVLVSSLLIVGPKVLPNIFLGLVNQLLLACIVVYTNHKHLPFSSHESIQRKTGSFIRGLSNLFALGLLSVGHYFVYSYLPVVFIFIGLSAIATWFLFDSIKTITWDKIKTADQEG